MVAYLIIIVTPGNAKVRFTSLIMKKGTQPRKFPLSRVLFLSVLTMNHEETTGTRISCLNKQLAFALSLFCTALC